MGHAIILKEQWVKAPYTLIPGPKTYQQNICKCVADAEVYVNWDYYYVIISAVAYSGNLEILLIIIAVEPELNQQ